MSFKNNRNIDKDERDDLCDIINRIIVECRNPKYKDYDIKASMNVKSRDYLLEEDIKIEEWSFNLSKMDKE